MGYVTLELVGKEKKDVVDLFRLLVIENEKLNQKIDMGTLSTDYEKTAMGDTRYVHTFKVR